MTPYVDLKVSDLEERKDSNLTYRLDLEQKRIYGKVDDMEACKQAISKIILTERFENVIYSEIYGVELKRFIGKDIDFIKSDIERAIKEALLVDDRVNEINNFNIEKINIDSLQISFNVSTQYGAVSVNSEVRI